MNSKRDIIINLFYNQKMSQKSISEKLNASKSYVSKIVRTDKRYQHFKSEKMQTNKKKHNKQIQLIVEKKRKQVQFNYAADDLILKKMHSQASAELSKTSHLSNENYRKWNKSAYTYNSSKKRYEFDETLGRSNDVPKYIKER